MRADNLLRWLVTVYSPCALIDRYYHLISVDVKIKVSNDCPIIGEQVMIIFLT